MNVTVTVKDISRVKLCLLTKEGCLCNIQAIMFVPTNVNKLKLSNKISQHFLSNKRIKSGKQIFNILRHFSFDIVLYTTTR